MKKFLAIALFLSLTVSSFAQFNTGFDVRTARFIDSLGVYYSNIKSIATIWRKDTIPDKDGTFLMTSDIPTFTNIYNSDGIITGNRLLSGSNTHSFRFDSTLVTFSGTYGSGLDPTTGSGVRMFFAPKYAAFRAGGINGSQWNASNIGIYSFAGGYNNTANGIESLAFGDGTTSSGIASTSLGSGTTSSGDYSFSAGNGNSSIGESSFSVGWNAKAVGNYSMTTGDYGYINTPSGVALGAFNDTTGYYLFDPIIYHSTDVILVVGAGDNSGSNNRANSLQMLRNGKTKIWNTWDYTANFHSNYNSRTLVDKGYVDSVAGGGGGYTLPSLTTGSVIFKGAVNLSQDNSNFFYDSTNHKLGIGTSSPDSALTVATGIWGKRGFRLSNLTYNGALKDVLMLDTINGGNVQKMKALTVELTSPTDGDFIVYQNSGDKAVNKTIAVPKMVATGAVGGYTGATTILTYTTPNDGNYRQYNVNASLNVTSVSADVIEVRVTYTDDAGTSRTKSFFSEGITTAGISTTGTASYPPMVITCTPNTSITIATVLTTGVGSIVYNCFGSIMFNFAANPF